MEDLLLRRRHHRTVSSRAAISSARHSSNDATPASVLPSQPIEGGHNSSLVVRLPLSSSTNRLLGQEETNGVGTRSGHDSGTRTSRTSLTSSNDNFPTLSPGEIIRENPMSGVHTKPPQMDFQFSPFYSTLVETVGSTRMVSPHGGTLKMDFSLNSREIQLLQGHSEALLEYRNRMPHQRTTLSSSSPSIALVLLCGIADINARESTQRIPVEFPKHFSVRINFVTLPSTYIAQYQRTSQKEWYSSPMDLTKFVKLKPNFRNTIDIAVGYHSQLPSTRVVYAHARFVFSLRIVEKVHVDQLVQQVIDQSDRASIESKDTSTFPSSSILMGLPSPFVNSVDTKIDTISTDYLFIQPTMVAEKREIGGEFDLISSWSRTGLRDPLSRQLIRLPCRGIACRHVECFDVEVYLRANEKHPKWQCPICHHPASIDNLRIDKFFQTILETKQAQALPDDVIISIDHRTGNWNLCSHNDDRQEGRSDIRHSSNKLSQPDMKLPANPSGNRTLSVGKSQQKRTIIDLTSDAETDHESEKSSPRKMLKKIDDDSFSNSDPSFQDSDGLDCESKSPTPNATKGLSSATVNCQFNSSATIKLEADSGLAVGKDQSQQHEKRSQTSSITEPIPGLSSQDPIVLD
jgi:hypothetical protein